MRPFRFVALFYFVVNGILWHLFPGLRACGDRVWC